jgi:hypothetical protein
MALAQAPERSTRFGFGDYDINHARTLTPHSWRASTTAV